MAIISKVKNKEQLIKYKNRQLLKRKAINVLVVIQTVLLIALLVYQFQGN